jgi:hypothetical protein
VLVIMPDLQSNKAVAESNTNVDTREASVK